MNKLKKLLESTLAKDFKIIKEETYILNEGIEEIKKYYPKIDDNMIKTLVALDPTFKGGDQLGKYGKWILNLYNNYIKDEIIYKKWEDQKNKGNNYPEPIRKSSEKSEDFEKLPDLLRQYDVINNKVKNDISNIKSISDLYSFVNNHKSQGISDNSKVNHAKDLVKKSVAKGGKIVFQDNNWVILIPKTLESSVVFGNDTNWCTTSPNGERYNGYKQEYGGEYFINVNLTTGDLYQFHFESEQFMDSTDKGIDILNFLNNNQDLFSFYKNYFKDSLIDKSSLGIIFIDNPSEKLQLNAFRHNKSAIKYIKKPSEKIQLAAVKQNGFAIKYIENPSERVQLEAVKQDSFAIKYIKNPSEKIQLAAVKEYGFAIEYIKNPTEKVQLAAIKEVIKRNYDIEEFIKDNIKNPTPKVKEYVKKIKNIKESKIPSLRVDEKKFKSSIFNLLFESNILTEDIASVKKYFPKVPEEKTQTLIKLDPTYQGGDNLGKYGKWILGLYNKGQLKDEDFYKVTEYLTTFKDNLKKIQNKDIMTYKSLPDLAKAIQPFEGQKDISKKQQVRDIKKGAKKVMETNDWLVIQPTTEESACYYGANTKWCTASKENSMFNYYNEQGPIYIFINKKDNSKFQFHAQSFQFMDELDKPIAPKEVFDDEKIINFIEEKVIDNVYSDNFYLWEDSLLMGLDDDGESNLFIQTNINKFFDSLYSEDTDINRQTIDIIENYFRGEITDTQKYYDDEELTFNSTIKTLFELYYAGRKLSLEHINTMKYYGFDYIGNEELVKYTKELKEHPLEDNDVRIYDLFEEIVKKIIDQINQHLNFFKVTDIEYIDSENDIRMYVETIYNSDNVVDANIDWFMNMNEPLYRDNIFEEIAHKIETPRTNNDILTEMLIHGIIKILNEDSESKSFNVEKNPKEDVVETYLKSTSLRFAFNPMNNDFIICDDLHNPIPLNESADKYITGILSPNLVEITSYIADDYNDSKEIVENLLGKRFKKIFKNHYEIIL